ncbi:lysylphosphatidylglycerol synthase transmembrane domain-containing protein [Sediminibacterium sp. C3]|uniref:lysylphosphatidylglycerol synthase transmembrane domain-containing protein n=1 Tax=Sediminibacterium sp. C3 TaxID=1267211 RepID=UPI0004260A7A|nr:lysylphosphatidylglycerol synthase transmembrane domain-containing protein [Sediminibacterium sp. C3]
MLHLHYKKVNWIETWNLIQSSKKCFLLLGLISFIISKIISSFRLNIYFKNINISLSQLLNLKLYWLGMFYNLFLPGSIGGDAYKVMILNRQTKVSIKTLISAVLFDRISGVLALFGLASFTTYLIDGSGNYFLLFFLSTILLMAFYYWVMMKVLKPHSILQCFVQTVLLGFIVQLFQTICVIFILKAMAIEQNFSEYILLFLLSSIAAILPISIGGLGIREMVYLWGCTNFSLNEHQGISISLLFYGTTVLVSFVGILWVFKNPFSIKN